LRRRRRYRRCRPGSRLRSPDGRPQAEQEARHKNQRDDNRDRDQEPVWTVAWLAGSLVGDVCSHPVSEIRRRWRLDAEILIDRLPNHASQVVHHSASSCSLSSGRRRFRAR